MQFELEKTGERRHERVKVDFTTIDAGKAHDATGNFQYRFILRCVVETHFFANSAQVERKQKHAEKMIYAHLFRDILPLVDGILLDADSDDVFKAASKIKEIILNGGAA